jgi:hypothetical protein
MNQERGGRATAANTLRPQAGIAPAGLLCVAADGFLRSDAPHVGPRHAAKQVHVAVACSQTPLSSQSKSLAQPTLEPLSLLLLSSPRWNRSALLTPLTGEQAVGHSVHETKTSSHL